MFLWAWGINGCFSVVGAALVPVIATSFGLAAVLIFSGCAYLLAISASLRCSCRSRLRRRERPRRDVRTAGCRHLLARLTLAVIAMSAAMQHPVARGTDDLGEDRAGRLRHFAVPLLGPAARAGQALLRRREGRPARPHLPARRHLLGGRHLQRPPRAAAYPARLQSGAAGRDDRLLPRQLRDLERDVHRRQQVPRQVAESGLNAVLVAPQLAVDAADSSAGRFYDAGAFRRFVEEAAVRLARLHGAPPPARPSRACR